MVRADVIQRLSNAALVAMQQEEPGASVTELASASFTLVSTFVETIVKHSRPEDLDFNKTALKAGLMEIESILNTPKYYN